MGGPNKLWGGQKNVEKLNPNPSISYPRVVVDILIFFIEAKFKIEYRKIPCVSLPDTSPEQMSPDH